MTNPGSLHAAVARVAAQAASSAVLFNVVHTRAKDPGDAQAAVAGVSPPTAPGTLATEALSFQVAGAGFRLYTWASEATALPAGGVFAARVPDGPVTNGGAEGQLYRGSVMINHGRSPVAARSTEVLVSLGHDPWSPGYGDSLMLAHASRDLTAAAARHGVPVLSLQSPVSPFPNTPRRFRADGSGEAPRVPNALALRMVLGGGTPGQRLDLVIELTEIARRNGFGLDVTDRRLGRVRGQWWTVLRADPPTYETRRRELFGWAPTEAPLSVLLCTILGPGRPGSTAAIATDLTDRNVGIAAVSATSLHGIAFVNLMIPVAPVRHVLSEPAGSVASIAEGLGLVATECGLTKADAVRIRSRIATSPAADHKLLTSGPFVSPPPAAAAEPDRPLWTSWSLPLDCLDRERQPDPMTLLLGHLTGQRALVADARIDYQRVRVSPDGRLTGRAKITISLAAWITVVRLPDTLTDLCERVRRETVKALVQQGIPLPCIELALDWRERWVGHIHTG